MYGAGALPGGPRSHSVNYILCVPVSTSLRPWRKLRADFRSFSFIMSLLYEGSDRIEVTLQRETGWAVDRKQEYLKGRWNGFNAKRIRSL